MKKVHWLGALTATLETSYQKAYGQYDEVNEIGIS
jgi:hypothetical protein